MHYASNFDLTRRGCATIVEDAALTKGTVCHGPMRYPSGSAVRVNLDRIVTANSGSVRVERSLYG